MGVEQIAVVVLEQGIVHPVVLVVVVLVGFGEVLLVTQTAGIHVVTPDRDQREYLPLAVVEIGVHPQERKIHVVGDGVIGFLGESPVFRRLIEQVMAGGKQK